MIKICRTNKYLSTGSISENHGLTLMETTIALGILMIGVMASLTLMLASFKYSQQSEYEIVVVNLAREGVEIMRAMRDNERDGDSTDIDLFDGTTYDDKKFIVDSGTINSTGAAATFLSTSDNQVTAGSIDDCDKCRLYLNAQDKYTHNSSGNTETIFKRMITISPGAADSEKIIISEISWTSKNSTHTYSIESHLTDWH